MTPRKKADEQPAEPKPKRTRSRKAKPAAAAEESATPAEPVEDVADEQPQAEAIEEEAAPEPPDPATLIGRMVVFHLADQRYGVPIASVQEIQQIVAFSEVPVGFDGVIGMINLRGHVIPAFDLRIVLGLPTQDFHVDTPMVICKTGDQLVAFVVDEVEDVLELPEGCLSPPPRMHALSGRMIGVCRMGMELIYLLDVDRLMEPLEIPAEEGA